MWERYTIDERVAGLLNKEEAAEFLKYCIIGVEGVPGFRKGEPGYREGEQTSKYIRTEAGCEALASCLWYAIETGAIK
eukprot:8186-Eustigmatos_ZCMA.PRE.1